MGIVLVTGPPASGKTTYVREHRKPGDITIDYDLIANTLAGADPDNHDHPAYIKAVTKAARRAAIDTAVAQAGDHTVWVIHADPSPQLVKHYRGLGAQVVTCDPGKDVVMSRVKRERPPELLKAAAAWYSRERRTMKIISAAHKSRPRGDLLIEAGDLPNPHQVPSLRVRTGRDLRVSGWLFKQPGVESFVQRQLDRITTMRPSTVVVTCSAGKHRSVAVAERLARDLTDDDMDVQVTHTQLNALVGKKLGREERGYGREHIAQREVLLRRHKDGTPCWWCGQPMFKDKSRNWDGKPLAADHSEEAASAGGKADRLLCFTCNSQRRDGKHDHLRPALTGRHPSEPLPTEYNLAREKCQQPEEPAEQTVEPAGFNFGGVSFA